MMSNDHTLGWDGSNCYSQNDDYLIHGANQNNIGVLLKFSRFGPKS
jgi:hypothetical protein